MKKYRIVIVDQNGSHTFDLTGTSILDAQRDALQQLNPQSSLGDRMIISITCTTLG